MALRRGAVACLAAALGGLPSPVASSEVTPVQKVIELMENMMQKGKDEKHAEQVQFAAYKQFCDDTVVDKRRAIEEAESKIEKLKADIEKHATTAEKLGREIAVHDEDIATWKGDLKAAEKIRDIEKANYKATHKDYSESIDALGRAIETLKKKDVDKKQASLVQVVSMNRMPSDVKRSIQAFLQDEPEPEMSAPEAYGYEAQSGGIIEMLEKLADKFVGERNTLEKEEMDAKHAYEMMAKELSDEVEGATVAREEKSGAKAKNLQGKADAEGDLEDTISTMAEDKKYVDDLVATCEQKATDFQARQALRAEELEAIEKAIEIISSNAVSGNAEKHLPSALLQRWSSLVSLRSSLSSASAAQDRAAGMLLERAQRLDSRVLSAVAMRMRMGADPFEKVKKIIKDLITRLMEEANEEAEHKGWCDTELSTNEQTRKEKTEAVETLHAEIDQLEASVSKLTEEISEMTKAVAKLDEAMAEATKLRKEEKDKNEKTIEDAQAAQMAVAQALTVLKEFYAKAGEATAFVQQQPEAPEIFDAPYKGMQSENGGIVGMLEVIESDFARLEAETKASESAAQKEYDTFMSDSAVDKESKSKSIEHKMAKKQDQSQALTVKTEDLEGTQKELDAALAYFDKLKPSCVDAGVSYEDRVARRKEEIESLQEALRILNGEDIA